MGLTVLELEVGNPASPKKTLKVEFLVDSGAVYSVVPTPILKKLGIRPNSQEEFRLADGSKIVRKKGIALFRHGKKVGGADVIFGEEGDSNASRRFHAGSPRPFTGPPAARIEAPPDGLAEYSRGQWSAELDGACPATSKGPRTTDHFPARFIIPK